MLDVYIVAVLMVANPPAITRFAPLLLLWWLSPVLAQFLSRPLDAAESSDSGLATPGEQGTELRGLHAERQGARHFRQPGRRRRE